jgi:hypothetical protein
MKVVYRHEFTVVVEDTASFSESQDLEYLRKDAERSRSTITMMVKKGSLEPQIVRSKVVSTPVVLLEEV